LAYQFSEEESMLKKMAFFALAMAVVLGSVGIASAAQNVKHQSKGKSFNLAFDSACMGGSRLKGAG